MKKTSVIFYIGGIVITLLIISIILFNTIFYDYKGRLHNYLDTYYTLSDNNIDNINKLFNRYTNNANKLEKINEILESDLNYRIEKFNTSYANIDELTETKDKLIDKVNYFFDNISINVSLINNNETVNNIINKLYESKTNYLTALNYYNENNYNDAYSNFIKVIEEDIYYEATTAKIDDMFNNEIKSLEDEVNSTLIIDENTSNNDKLTMYKKALESIINKKKNSSFDISKSKVFNTIKTDINNNLTEIYLNIVNDYTNNGKINDAINLLNDCINYLNNNELDTTKLRSKRDELNNMQPISLTSIKGNINGSSIKEELAISDINNDAYPRNITFYKNDKSSVTYDLNGEYKYLSGIINICKEVNQKKKNYGKIIIYGDDKKIFDSGDLNTKFKIEYNISNSNSINKSNILVALFGNPTLEKY